MPQSKASLDSLVERVIDAISRELPAVVASKDRAWELSPALAVLDCVLSLNRNYDRFVVPRIERFRLNHPNTTQISDLKAILDSYADAAEFLAKEMAYRDAGRAIVFEQVVALLLAEIAKRPTQQESESLRDWAVTSTPSQGLRCPIQGFKLAGWQYLRMLLGADTCKPDVHIVRFVERAVASKITPVQALTILESAAGRCGYRLIDLDTTIWESSARATRNLVPVNNEQHVIPWTTVAEMLAVIHRRPAMWLGAKSLERLRGFIAGWETAQRQQGSNCRAFSDFEEWFAMYKHDGLSFDIARLQGAEDHVGFDLWFSWFNEFLSVQGGLDGA